jgi:tetratricopeptide (TPR) repeat protein
MKVYSSREVAKLLGISLRQVYGHARAGFLKPARGKRRAYRFSFQDLVLLRAARALADANIPARRVRNAFRRLIRELPEGHSLGNIRISAEGRRIVARDGNRTWNPESGQLQLDFRGVRRVSKRKAVKARPTRAYELTLRDDPRNADAQVNLGRLLYEQNEVVEAIQHFRKALGLKRNHATAAFNLGIALEDLGETNDAIVAYRRAVESDPYFADAHHNLSQLYQKTGQPAAARRHLTTYRELSSKKSLKGEGSKVKGKSRRKHHL